MNAPLLQLHQAAVSRHGRDRRFLLEVEEFVLRAGERLALVSPSGRGKSTLLNLLALALRPDVEHGFSVNGVDVAALWQRNAHDALAALRAATFGYVVQTGSLLPSLTAWENIMLSQRIARRGDGEQLAHLAVRLGIVEILGDPPSRLSVGERQRVAIARALVHEPSIVLADEPTASLDPSSKQAVMELLLGLQAERHFALVLASHDLETLDAFNITTVEPVISVEPSQTRSVFRYTNA